MEILVVPGLSMVILTLSIALMESYSFTAQIKDGSGHSHNSSPLAQQIETNDASILDVGQVSTKAWHEVPLSVQSK